MQGNTSRPVDIRHKLPPLKALTSVRFGAALYVGLFHTNLSQQFPRVAILQRFLQSGYTAVTFFFVLSGFILAYNYPSIPSVKGFWIARLARVYPVYLLSILVAVLLHGLHGLEHPVLALGMVLGLVQAYFPAFFAAINPVAWTLSVEAFFYLMMPLLLPWMRRMGWRHFFGLQALYGVVVVSPCLLAAAGHGSQGMVVARWLESSVPVFRLNTFVVGLFLGLWWNAVQRHDREWVLSATQRWMCLSGGTVIAVFLLQLAPATLYLPLRTLGLTYAFAMLIVGLAKSRNPLLVSHSAQMAGEISYGFYILQFPVIAVCSDLQFRVWPGVDTIHHLWVFLPAVAVAAYVSFRWFEIPARLWLRRRLTGGAVMTRVI